MRSTAFVFAVAMLASSSGLAPAQTVIAPPPQILYGPPVSLDQAKRMLAAAEAEAKKINVGMVITVVDSGGHEVMMQRLDGAQLGSIQAARDKAHSAIFYRRPTKIFQDRIAEGGINLRLLQLTGANVIEGGWPIIVDGKLIGAIAASGGLTEQDSQVAKAGIAALGK